jgi:arabinogalactan endo-1,4-beta-galactosidase
VARRVPALILLGIAIVVCTALAASESLRNRTGNTTTAVTVTFSEKVTITGYNSSVFMTQEPTGKAESFRFSGGQLEDGGRFMISWSPSDAEILESEWETAVPIKEDFMLGVHLTSYLTKRVWDGVWRSRDPLVTLREHGFEWASVRMRTTSSSDLRSVPPESWDRLPWNDEYWCSAEMAEQMLKEAAAAGYRLWLYLNLSDRDAIGAYQRAPAEWAGLSVEQTAARLEEYTYTTVKHLADQGLDIEVYSMSGEIEWGIEDFGPSFNEGGRIPPPTEGVDMLTYVKQDVWPTEARLLKAAIAGTRRANPDARILLYVSGQCFFPSRYGEIRSFTAAFFETMAQLGVDFDIAGFSWVYPYCGECWPFPGATAASIFQTAEAVAQKIAALGKPVIIAEAGYPSAPQGIPGTTPMPGYPYTPEGQATWVRDMLQYARNSKYLSGFFYFGADWIPRPYHTQEIWHMDGNSLFNMDESAKPALDEFQKASPPQ